MKKGSVGLVLAVLVAAALLVGGFAVMLKTKTNSEVSTSVPLETGYQLPKTTNLSSVEPSASVSGSVDVDAQLKALDKDSASIDASLKDVQIDVMK